MDSHAWAETGNGLMEWVERFNEKMGIGKGDLACMVSMHEGEYQGINSRDEDVTLKLVSISVTWITSHPGARIASLSIWPPQTIRRCS